MTITDRKKQLEAAIEELRARLNFASGQLALVNQMIAEEAAEPQAPATEAQPEKRRPGRPKKVNAAPVADAETGAAQ